MISAFSRRLATLVLFPSLLAVLPLAAGCGGEESEDSTLTGKVLFDGKPVSNGLLKFEPTTGSQSGLATVSADGTYEARVGRSMVGLPTGTYKVVVEAWEVMPGNIGDDGKVYPNGKPLVPQSYSTAATSPLSITVQPGANEIDLELEGDIAEEKTEELED